MFKSFKLFRLLGVDINIHWSWFLLFPLFVSFSNPISEILIDILTVIMIFSFVLIHEFGHILAARRYGVNTTKITLSIIGGMAHIDETIEDLTPKQTLWVVFAGPLTNVVLFILFIPICLYVFWDFNWDAKDFISTMTPLQELAIVGAIVNVNLFIFNLIPIYPMDGGRLLRSTLELCKVKNSTIISLRITQIFCILLLFWGVFVLNITACMIAVLFFTMAWFDIRKRRLDTQLDIIEQQVMAIGDDVKNKINVILNELTSDEAKLAFLDDIDNAITDTNRKLIMKRYTDELREDIKRVRNNG